MTHKSEITNNHKGESGLIPTIDWGKDCLIDVEKIEHNLLEIKDKIAPCKPKIIGVTKYFGAEAIVSGYRAGIRDFGESRANDAIEKIMSLPQEIRQNISFHFIGHLQTNKVGKVVANFDCIHSVDSLKLARVISENACSLNKRVSILLQENNAREEQKFGYDKDCLKQDLLEITKLQGIQLIGLMNMAKLDATESEIRGVFRDLREFRDELEKEFNLKIPELSMGMSNDYQIATEEGATIIRIGRKLFN